MSRILVLGVVAVLLFGGVLAADQALQNPDLEPADAGDDAKQQDFAEATAPFFEVAAPLGLFVIMVGIALAAVRAVGG